MLEKDWNLRERTDAKRGRMKGSEYDLVKKPRNLDTFSGIPGQIFYLKMRSRICLFLLRLRLLLSVVYSEKAIVRTRGAQFPGCWIM